MEGSLFRAQHPPVSNRVDVRDQERRTLDAGRESNIGDNHAEVLRRGIPTLVRKSSLPPEQLNPNSGRTSSHLHIPNHDRIDGCPFSLSDASKTKKKTGMVLTIGGDGNRNLGHLGDGGLMGNTNWGVCHHLLKGTPEHNI